MVSSEFIPAGYGPTMLIEEQAARAPQSPALVMGSESLSYEKLNARANRLAHFLRKKGIQPEQLVGVFLDRGFDSVVSLLAILKAGAAYLPLDPSFPVQRLAYMLADARTPLILTHTSKRQSLPETDADVVLLDEEQAWINSSPDDPPSLDPAPQLGYVIYTSGSTGKPKGVMVPRHALANFLYSMRTTPGMNSSDTLLANTTVSFDISILELLLPLVTGARLAIARKEEAYDPTEIKRLIETHNVTVMQATPTTWRMLVESGWSGKRDLRILCGGEALPRDLAAALLPRCQELWNMYGPTETTIWSSLQRVMSADEIWLGEPITNTQLYVVDEQRRRVAPGTPGELLIGGTGVALGYLHKPDLTAQRFIPDTFTNVPGARLYCTGDEVRLRPTGELEFLGRMDGQVKFNGFRIELGEIEARLAQIEGIRQAVVVLREDCPNRKRLVAYYTGKAKLNADSLTAALAASLPQYMTPSVFVHVEQFPLTPNGKLDRKALPAPPRQRPALAQAFIAARTPLEKRLASLWCELLQLDEIGIDDSFFDLGGTSLLAVRMVGLYQRRFERDIPPVKVFQYPTVSQLCCYLEESGSGANLVQEMERRFVGPRRHGSDTGSAPQPVAVIGMVGRFPGAANLDELWQNLRNSVESISVFTPEELGPGIEPYLRNDPDYVRARGIIEGADLFDAAFFGISPLEAQVMDPQQRLFLELAHHALENAGYDPSRYAGRIGVFAGTGDNHYYTINLLSRPDLLASAGKLAVEYGNEKDYIALRVAYLLDLRGPALSINTACSTSLVTIDTAYNALLNFECDMALAGGIDIGVPQKSGFLYQEGGTFARDGHCRPFDAEATGTMFCDGAGLVVLKRLDDALADGDSIYAVIRGSAKNNNGGRPASFLAPNVDGQAEVIAMAQARANVPVETIRYIEAHGTGTPLGDPMEFEALRQVFEAKTGKKQFCYLGSIKGNVGHPTNAAGAAGFIKAAMVLHREEIPPILYYKTANPKIDFAQSPFLPADRLIPFPREKQIRRTAVSSFGFGGTNAHMILEEAPERRPLTPARPVQLLLLSARTAPALDAYAESLAQHLEQAPASELPEAAFTLQVGRKPMAQRRFVVATDAANAAALLRQAHPLRCGNKRCERRDPPLVFLFGGQGTQYVNMGKNLYQGEPLFRAVVDDCCEILKPHLGRDLREVLYPRDGDEETARQSLEETFFTQPALFVIEYALARLWQSLGVEPAHMVGHSIGEFVAATLAGVWELPDVLRIVALRGQLMQALPRGSMLAINRSAEEVAAMLPVSLQLASNNAPSLCVASGPEAEIASFADLLKSREIVCRRLHTSHAFHSAMMNPMVEPLRAEVAKATLRPPTMPFVSTVTGQPITEAEATNPEYWAMHARATVQFAKALQWLVDHDHDFFLECGPRATSCTLARQHFGRKRGTAVPSLSDTPADNAEWITWLFALGTLWQNGCTIDWNAFYANEERRRIPLPVYPFERQRYWVEPAVSDAAVAAPAEHGRDARGTDAALQDGATATPPRSRKELLTAKLIEILIPISGHDRSEIDPAATFLEQGFDSLSLTQAAFAIRKEWGVRVSFSQLMKDVPSIEMLAAHLDATLAPDLLAEAPSTIAPALPAESAPTPAAVAAPIDAPAESISARRASPLLQMPASVPAVAMPTSARTVESTAPQRGIYYSSRLSDHLSASYNESVTLRLDGHVSVPGITRALEWLVQRHEALRASFDESGAVMKIAPPQRIEVPVTDLRSFPTRVAREARLTALLTRETATPFNLPGGPLFRSHIVLMDTSSAAVVMTGHHIICDGWSLDVLIRDFCGLYSEELSGRSVALPVPNSFADYAASAAERARSREFDEAREYWHRKFANGYPALVLPTDNPRPVRRDYATRRLDRTVPAEVVERMRALGAKRGCSFFTVVLGALALLMARISRRRRFVLVLPTADQATMGQPDLVGHCVSLLPLLVELRPGESIGAFFTRLQSELAEAQDHSAYNLVNLLDELRPVNAAQGNSPVAAGLTSVKKYAFKDLIQNGFGVDYDSNPMSYQAFEFYLNAVEIGEHLELKCHCDTQLFETRTANGWLDRLAYIIQQATADPAQSAEEMAALGEGKETREALYLLRSAPTENKRLAAESVAAGVPQVAPPGVGVQHEELLESMLALWRRTLNTRTVGPDDDFFALGGHSITAAQLFMLIERELGVSAPLATLFEFSTPRTLTHALAQGDKHDAWRSLVAINRFGHRRPLFLIHAAEGNVLLYRDLARYLGPDQPVYGLQAAGLDGKSPIDAQFEHVAASYVREIRRVQPHGPYLLGGYCLGGTIALEVARQLGDEGQPVGLIAMIENFNVKSTRWPLPWYLRMVNRVLNPYYHLLNLLAADARGRWEFFRQKARVEFTRAQASARVALARVRRLFGIPSEYHHIKVADAFDHALAAYQVKPYDGEVTVFVAKRRLAGMNDPFDGWGEVAEGGVHVFTLPSSPRGSLVEPYVQALATQLRDCLDQMNPTPRPESEPLSAAPLTEARERARAA